MKKFTVWTLLASLLSLCIWVTLAQNVFPDSAEITVKGTILEWEATNLWVTMMKNGSKMSNYNGTVRFSIEDENWLSLSSNEYTLPDNWLYEFLPQDLWSKEFQKWLEIKKEWIFYIIVEDLNDPDWKELWRQAVTVVKNSSPVWDVHINVFDPKVDDILEGDKVNILAEAPWLQNSQALIYIDNNAAIPANVDSSWIITHSINNVEVWNHTLKIEISNIDWTIIWTSDNISFTVQETNNVWIKNVTVEPEELLMVWDKTTITVYTDEIVESVKMKLSDRSDSENDGLIMTKDDLWVFSYNVYLLSTWSINISFETSSQNNSRKDLYENVKQFTVLDTPQISNVKVEKDEEKQTATVSWEILNWEPVLSYIVKYRAWDKISWEEQTEKQTFTFTDVPYDQEINLNITPVRKNSLNMSTHWAASKTIQFIITKPNKCWNWEQDEWEDCMTCPQDLWDQCEVVPTCWNWEQDEWENCTNCPQDLWDQCKKEPRCTIQNISTRTVKVWDSYYLIWDKIENVSKYIVYSSTSEDGHDKVKVYETSDTSYEYPFDYKAEKEQFAYFWIVWICDDGEKLELWWATKVQVWPAENFFLLMSLTFLIYFWIKLFRQTE